MLVTAWFQHWWFDACLLTGAYRSVVLYDEATADISHLVKDSNMYLVAKTLQEMTQVQDLNFLEGASEQPWMYWVYL